jgi:glycosyltransferase involved in cell wall biosynthesis
MRVVILSKALLAAAYRGKLAALALQPDIDLTAIVPPAWHDRRGLMRLEPGPTPGYRLIVAPLWFNGHYHLHFYPTLGRLLDNLRPDAVHVDEEPYNLAAWQATWLAGRVGAHTCFFTWQNLDRRYPFPFAWFERDCYRRAGHAIAGNQDASHVLRAKGYAGPITVIPQFGVDPDQFAPMSASAGPPPPDAPFTIGYAGGLIAEKGLESLIQAAAGLTGEWRLVLAGEGAERPHLEQLAQRLGMTARVIFRARLGSTTMPQFYRQLHVLVLPSQPQPNWKEQFGRVLIEAMACGVPVIGSDCGEIPHVIDQAGLVFPAGDVSALRAHLARLQADPALRQILMERGRARVLTHYTHAQIASATAQVYRSLAADSASLP